MYYTHTHTHTHRVRRRLFFFELPRCVFQGHGLLRKERAPTLTVTDFSEFLAESRQAAAAAAATRYRPPTPRWGHDHGLANPLPRGAGRWGTVGVSHAISSATRLPTVPTATAAAVFPRGQNSPRHTFPGPGSG